MIDPNIIVSLISALIAVESGGDPNAVGDNGDAVGILQIHKCVVDDVNNLLLDDDDMFDYADRTQEIISKEICRLYLGHYGKYYERKTGNKPTLEVLARIWNGGPNGWRDDPEWFVGRPFGSGFYTLESAKRKIQNTKDYWLKVSAEMEKQK